MYRLLTTCLWLTSFLLCSCSSPYRHLQKTAGDAACIQKFKPEFTSVSYNTAVDVVGHHISGILLMKTMPDSSIRLVFATQIGFKFFDFGFSKDSGFQVYYILKQMDKKAAIKALRKDFELILFRHTDPANGTMLQGDGQRFYAFPQETGTNYYVTDSTCSQLVRIEKSSTHKVVVEAIMKDYHEGTPDTIGITHKNFNFVISMKKLGHATK